MLAALSMALLGLFPFRGMWRPACVVLAILIHVTRRGINANHLEWDDALSSASEFDILVCNTLPELQNEFCALWNELVQKARGPESHYDYVRALRWIRQLYIALHQGTESAPTAFDTYTDHRDDILSRQSSYPLCTIDTHRPTQPIPGSSAAPQQAEANDIGLPSSAHHCPLPQRSPSPSSATDSVHIAPQVTSDTTPSVHESVPTVNLDLNPDISMEDTHLLIDEMGEYAQTSSATLLTHSHPEPVPATVTSSIVAHPPTVSVEQHGAFSNTLKPGITSNITLFHPLDAHNRQDTTASHARSDIALISSNGSV